MPDTAGLTRQKSDKKTAGITASGFFVALKNKSLI